MTSNLEHRGIRTTLRNYVAAVARGPLRVRGQPDRHGPEHVVVALLAGLRGVRTYMRVQVVYPVNGDGNSTSHNMTPGRVRNAI